MIIIFVHCEVLYRLLKNVMFVFSFGVENFNRKVLKEQVLLKIMIQGMIDFRKVIGIINVEGAETKSSFIYFGSVDLSLEAIIITDVEIFIIKLNGNHLVRE